MPPSQTQTAQQILGQLSVMESLLPKITDAKLRAEFQTEIIKLRQLASQL